MSVQSDSLEAYRVTAARRWRDKEEGISQRQIRALKLAQQVAGYLRAEYGVTDVILFGSLVHGHWYNATSDIDLAVRDIAKDEYFAAVARLQDFSPEFKVDLIDLRNCDSDFRRAIEAEGRRL